MPELNPVIGGDNSPQEGFAVSTSMYAATLLVDPAMKWHAFGKAQDLMAVQPLALEPRAGLHTYGDKGGRVVTEVSGASRHDFLRDAVARMGAMASLTGLDFMTGKPHVPCQWRLSLGVEGGAAGGQACGYWLEGAGLSKAHAAVSVLLEWAKDNVGKIGGADFLGFYEGEAEIRQRIVEGLRAESPRPRGAWYAEDGDGPGYLFAYLGTARHVIGNALVAGKAVLHVAELPN